MLKLFSLHKCFEMGATSIDTYSDNATQFWSIIENEINYNIRNSLALTDWFLLLFMFVWGLCSIRIIAFWSELLFDQCKNIY